MDNTEKAEEELRKNLVDKYNMTHIIAKRLADNFSSKIPNLSMMNMAMLAAAIYYQEENRTLDPPLKENTVKKIMLRDSKIGSMDASSLRSSLIRHLRYLDLISHEEMENE